MTKPKKIAKEISKQSYLFDTDCSYTPERLRQIADEMDEQGILYLELEADAGYNNVDFICKAYRMETPEELDKRYEKEINAYEKERKKAAEKKAKRKSELIKEAKKLGLKVEE